MNRSSSNQVIILPGSLTAPGLAFAGDQNTGIYQASADTFSIVINGVVVATFSSSALQLNVALDNTTTGVSDADIISGFTALKDNFDAGTTLLGTLGF